MATPGLPPRTRGSLVVDSLHNRPVGPTPAYAGITSHPPRTRSETEAYPRVRGDHVNPETGPSAGRGLPPRTRGSHRHVGGDGPHHGPTPAYAGITPPMSVPMAAPKAYPRVRGDHHAHVRRKCLKRGLPPRTRGSPAPVPRHVNAAGPTPAYAGITHRQVPRDGERRAYPRVRGDHPDTRHVHARRLGLPPRTRGSPVVGCVNDAVAGPTPAYAGITATAAAPSPRTAAYPRVRGDHGYLGGPGLHGGGLPPRTRGSPARGKDRQQVWGPTPAYAGITHKRTSAIGSVKAYPRVRGDHS